ncbi:MAG: DNA cytosine methyltransferase [Proteobacteria bacterium]|nr:DNA cytosine methyltransferase [Pseudomonadota bacterium]
MKNKYNTIDLFAGCGGLTEGFHKNGSFNTLACVEWEENPCKNLINRLKTKWRDTTAEEKVLRFDIQRTEELFSGWDDTTFGKSKGLDFLTINKKIDIIIGGPPCQAYSLAGRIQDSNNMKDDYRNYLFESYLKVVNKYQPKFIIFENVPGMLSAKPGGTPIVDKIRNSFKESNYEIINNFKDAQFNLSEYGVPQNRKRIIIFGVNKNIFKDNSKKIVTEFYNEILKYKVNKKISTWDAISDISDINKTNNKYKNHENRFHSERDKEIFQLLAKDIENQSFKYTNSESLKELYYIKTGKKSNVHKYHVIRKDLPSNTIPAHLYKDGLRHIHPDHEQSRSITVREAARLQTFDDDYEFISGMTANYKMIGNAVPPLFSKIIADTLEVVLKKY